MLVSPSRIRFVFSSAAETDDLHDGDEVEKALQAAVAGVSAEQFAQRDVNPFANLFGEEAVEPESVEVATEKLRVVTERFDLNSLDRRRWLKTTAKTGTPGMIEWDTAAKYSEDTIPAPPGGPVPFALLRLEEHQSTTGSRQQARPDIVFTLDSEDIDYMLGLLTELRAALGEVTDSLGEATDS